MTSTNDHLDRLTAALTAIEAAAAENAERSREIKHRSATLRSRLEAGESLLTLVADEERPRVVELLSTNMATLESAGAELRAAEALALRTEGLTIEAIANLFGVTRQRISALLKQKTATARE
ncbi:MAG: transcriptional regulator [Candidatus Poriferisodalaceae bacterium]|jgi:transcriptional regulator